MDYRFSDPGSDRQRNGRGTYPWADDRLTRLKQSLPFGPKLRSAIMPWRSDK